MSFIFSTLKVITFKESDDCYLLISVMKQNERNDICRCIEI